MVFLTFLYYVLSLQLTFKSSSDYEGVDEYKHCLVDDYGPPGVQESGDRSPEEDEQTSLRSVFQAYPLTMSDEVKTLLV